MSDEHEQSQLAKDYGPKWSYKHSAQPLSNAPVDNPLSQIAKWFAPSDLQKATELHATKFLAYETYRMDKAMNSDMSPGSFFIGDAAAATASTNMVTLQPPLTEERMREIVAEMLDKRVEERVHEVLDEIAREANENKACQPVSARVDKHATDPELPAVNTPSGICWTCGEHGESGAMMWLDRFGKNSHLIHATEECIRAAELKPELREHRG
jgi:hypothetical protein